MLETPNFARIDAKATGMRMQVQTDKTIPSTYGAPTREKGWIGHLSTGPFGLIAIEATGPKGIVSSCGVFALVPDHNTFRTAFLHDLNLPPAPQSADATGAVISVWRDFSGPGTTAVLRSTNQGAKVTETMMATAIKTPN